MIWTVGYPCWKLTILTWTMRMRKKKMKTMKISKKRKGLQKCWIKPNNHPKMRDETDQEDLDHGPDLVIVTDRIAKDVAPDPGIGKIGYGKDLDPDLNPGKGDLGEMNLGKGLEKRKEGKIKNAKIGIDLKGITKKDDKGGSKDSMSVEETNAMRASLGLPP